MLVFAAAGDAFKKAAELHLTLDTKHEAANNYTEAAQVMKRDEPRGERSSYRPGHYPTEILAQRTGNEGVVFTRPP